MLLAGLLFANELYASCIEGIVGTEGNDGPFELAASGWQPRMLYAADESSCKATAKTCIRLCRYLESASFHSAKLSQDLTVSSLYMHIATLYTMITQLDHGIMSLLLKLVLALWLLSAGFVDLPNISCSWAMIDTCHVCLQAAQGIPSFLPKDQPCVNLTRAEPVKAAHSH